MEFTNDIKFNKKPISNKLLKITYSGELFKNNSSEVSIVYGFGESWEKTTEQKMYKTSKGFSCTLLMENYDTFNFCFKNNNNVWDNNNYFNYISPIEVAINEDVVNTVPSKENNNVESFNQNLNKSETSKVNESSDVLDILIQELFEEYSLGDEKNSNISFAEPTPSSLSNTEVIDIDEEEFDKFFEEFNQEPIAPSQIETYQELSRLFDELFENSEETTINSTNTTEINKDNLDSNTYKELTELFNEFSKEVEKTQKEKNIDIGIELDKIFVDTFTGDFIPSENTTETYLPFSVEDEYDINDYIQDMCSENSASVAKNIEVQNSIQANLNPEFNMLAYIQDMCSENSISVAKNIEVQNSIQANLNPEFNMLAYIQDMCSENSISATKHIEAQNAIQANLNPEFNMLAYIQKSTSEELDKVENEIVECVLDKEAYILKATTNNYEFVQEKETSVKTQNIFDFENMDFDLNISKSQPELLNSNNFSDSFYDDEDVSTHDYLSGFQEIVNNTINDLSQETDLNKLEETNAEYQKQSDAFDQAVSEYAEYFDNLINEILSTPISALSTSISNDQVFENEQTDLSISENKELTSITEKAKVEGVPDEYALYDYKTYSFFYMVKRRVKLIFSSLFTKIPKLFGRETDNNND